MTWLEILIMCAVFLFAATLTELFYLVWVESRFAEKRTVKKRLLYISAGGQHGKEKLDQYRNRVLKDVGTFERLTFSLPRIHKLDRMLLKAGIPLNASAFILLSLALAGLGIILGLIFLPNAGSRYPSRLGSSGPSLHPAANAGKGILRKIPGTTSRSPRPSGPLPAFGTCTLFRHGNRRRGNGGPYPGRVPRGCR